MTKILIISDKITSNEVFSINLNLISFFNLQQLFYI